MSDCEPVIDFASSIAPLSDIQTLAVRNLDGSGRKAASDYRTVMSTGQVVNSKVKIQPKPVTTVQSPGIRLLLLFFLECSSFPAVMIQEKSIYGICKCRALKVAIPEDHHRDAISVTLWTL
jgi:hypothetical protein